MTEDELEHRVEERLTACGITDVLSVNSPTVRAHRDRWCVVLADRGDVRRAVYVLEHTDGVTEVKGSKSSALVTFEAT